MDPTAQIIEAIAANLDLVPEIVRRRNVSSQDSFLPHSGSGEGGAKSDKYLLEGSGESCCSIPYMLLTFSIIFYSIFFLEYYLFVHSDTIIYN